VSITSNSATLYTAGVKTSPTLEAAASVPINSETITLPTEYATVVNTASYPTSLVNYRS